MLAWTSTKPCSLWRARHGRTRGHIQGNPEKSQIAALIRPRVGVSVVMFGSSATCGCQWLMVLTKLTFCLPLCTANRTSFSVRANFWGLHPRDQGSSLACMRHAGKDYLAACAVVAYPGFNGLDATPMGEQM